MTDIFKHYLVFTSLNRTDLYEINEPIGFDSANFVLKQESKRYARSISYGAIDKITFIDAFGSLATTPQTINPQGDQSTHLDYGLQWLLPIYKDYGFEAKVEYIIEKSGVQFSGGMLDFTDKDITDGYTYLSCKLIQKNKVANFKRRFDDKFNLFGIVNASNETITPVGTIDFLRKATPLRKKSSWRQAVVRNIVAGGVVKPFNEARQIDVYGINNTLTPFDAESSTFNAAMNNFKYIRAQNDLTENILTVNANIDFHYQQSGGDTSSLASFQLWYGIWNGASFDLSQEYGLLYEKVLSGTATQDFTLNEDLVIPINPIQRDFNLSLFWQVRFSIVHSGLTTWHFKDTSFNIVSTETAIDTVVKGVRWIDGIKQASKFTSDIPVNAPLFDVSGVHYKNVLFNRRMVSQKVDNFSVTPKIIFESVEEVNCDFEPNEHEIFIGHQSDYYTDTEIGVFNVIPSEDFSIEENDRCQINKFKYAYKTFEQDRTVSGTTNAIHTDTEWRFLNDNVENSKEVALDFIRDPLTIQAMVDLEVTQPTTSTSDDDKVYIQEIVGLAPNSFNEFGARLLMRIIDGKVELLNRDSEGDSSNVVINWTILGINVGASFIITFGENIGSYTVFALTNSVLTLTPLSFTPTYNGNSFIRVKYFYNNISFVTRTSEGFISNPNGMQNAGYSIKRNMNYFKEYFASCLLYSKKEIPNAYFKSNGEFTSQLTTELEPVTENATILYESLPIPLTSAKVYNVTCVAEFNDVLNYLEAYKNTRGFIRCFDSNGRVVKGYIQKLDDTWASNMIKFTLEERFETEYLLLNYTDGILTVNDAQYNLTGVSDWWRFDNDYLKLYDENNIPISNFYKYNFVSLQGTVYQSKAELVEALILLS